ncbi:MAG: hypothetical protein NTV09_09705 [Bacteroidetes bacterium]|nr:hypothetical protein [Bacteroidota bacterium]
MPRILNKLFIILPVFFCQAVFAVQGDSSSVKVPTIIRYTTGEHEIGGELKYLKLDSVLDDLEVFNPAIRNFYHDLGNIGSASEPQLISNSTELLSRFGNNSFALYQWDPSKIKFYKTNKRFTNLDYHLSGGKEQQITITLAQNILANWNAGIDFNRQGSLGFLNNGKTFITNFNFFTWYHLPNNRYHAFASATWNSIKNEVNGGLANDSLYKSSNFSNNDLKGLQISLSDAEQHVRNHVFSLTHYYDLIARKDSAGKESSYIRIEHHSEYARLSYDYSDNASDTSYYRNNYFTSDIQDSLRYDQWVNSISLKTFHSFGNFKPVHRLATELTGGNQWFNFEQLYDTTLTNYFAEARLKTSGIKDLTGLDVSGRYILSGANKSDYLFRLKFMFPLPFGASMHIGLQDALQSPTLFQNFYQSNHFIWVNNFGKATSRQFFFGINLDKYHFSVAGTSTFLDSYIYFDTLAVPLQSNENIRVSQLFIKKDFRFRKFHLNNSLWIQETNNDVIRIPGLASHHSLYFEDIFFKNKLPIQIGFDVHYTSSYFSNAYSPAASVFYTQNSTKTGGYALVDFFVNFKIKSARMFIKLQNAGDNLVADNYFNTPNFPMPGMLIQFGINWRFYD